MNRPALIVCLMTVSLTFSAAASAQTIVVTTGADAVDFASPQHVANLPGPDGLVSVREAITAANNTEGPQTIAFAIPRERWWTLFPNHAACRLEYALFITSPDTTLDCTTQTQLTGDTNPSGWEVAFYYAGPPSGISHFMVYADRTTIKGLDYIGGNALGSAVRFYGSDNRLISCTEGSVAIDREAPGAPASTGNIIGGTLPGEGNRLSSVTIAGGSDGNTVVGNVIRRIAVSGDTLYGSADNNRIGGPTPAERNVISGNALRGEEGFPYGTQVSVMHARGTVIEGNYIGTTEDGMAMWPALNGTTGIAIGDGAVNTFIRNNLISGIARTGSNHYQGQRFGTAIVVSDGTNDTRIVGNRLGTTADGEGVIVNVSGIFVERPTVQADPLTGLLIGTSAPGEGNVITGSEREGISIQFTVSGVRISGNSISGNAGLGIDLYSHVAGLTPNDPGDADTGGNNLQNFPVIESATSSANSTRLTGVLRSAANRSYTIEFFGNGACDASGHGEGETFLGATVVATDTAGEVVFDVSVPTGVPVGAFITSTATRHDTSDTSEFSACVPVSEAACAADFNTDGTLDSRDFFDFLAAFFAGSGDFNADGAVDSQDFFSFLTAFFTGC